MPRKSHITIARVSMLILVGLAVFTPMAHAQSEITSFLGHGLWDLIAEGLAILSQWVLSIMVLWVAITGALLNVSITLTLHIRDFVNSVPGVYQVWQTIRDISSIFIIFMLLYASFMLILDQQSKPLGSVGNLIKNIVIGGILINFSFFIVSILIDASNIVSLALYNGIVGAPSSQISGSTTNPSEIVADMMKNADGGLSGIFATYVTPQSIISPQTIDLSGKKSSSADWSKPLQIIIQADVGIVLMFIAGMSFLLAALAFVARLAILIFLLAFSPIWFAAMIFPILDDKKKEFTSHLKAQLVFMPVYLLLLYAALRVLSSTKIFTNPDVNFLQTSGSGFWGSLMVLAINDFFILFLLNLPLVVAFGFVTKEGGGLGFMKGYVDKFSAHNVWKNVGSFTGRRTLGRAAYAANESGAMGWLASRSPLAGGIVSKGLSNVSSAGFGMKGGGYEDALKARKKAQEKMSEKLENIDKTHGTTYQEKYRANLPWKSFGESKPQGVMGFLLDNRANKETQRKLNEVADKKAIKANAKSTSEDVDIRVKGIDKMLESLEENKKVTATEFEQLIKTVNSSAKVNEARKALGLDSTTKNEENRATQIVSGNEGNAQMIKRLKEERENQIKRKEDAQNAAKEIEKKEGDEKLISTIKDELKNSGGSSGGGGAPKTP